MRWIVNRLVLLSGGARLLCRERLYTGTTMAPPVKSTPQEAGIGRNLVLCDTRIEHSSTALPPIPDTPYHFPTRPLRLALTYR